MKQPRIAFCTTCKGRTQHLQQTLPKNLADNTNYANCVFIVLDYGDKTNLIDYLKYYHMKDIESGRLVIYSYDTDIFKMAHAKNMAHRCGILEGADILVNLDADNFTGVNFANYIAARFQELGKYAFLWAKMIPGQMSRGISGRIVVTKHAFINAGGYDEQYHQWGPDDKDFNLRLQRLGYVKSEIDIEYLEAVRHNDKMRFREYPHIGKLLHKSLTEPDSADATAEQFEAVNDSDETIANYGDIGCGVVYRNFDMQNAVFEPISIIPIPTRIFGIGMHKTATTSLHNALKILGVDSAHWQNAHWAKAIYQEMMGPMGRSNTLERHYALCDLPITILYKELDKAYPGSKFILTTKHRDKWLQSVKDHWDYDYNKYRASWDTDPFTHRLHNILYGRKSFDAEVFLARYDKHNLEVLEYFKGREQDLAIMHMDNGAGWKELCRVTNLPIPVDTPYPTIDPVI